MPLDPSIPLQAKGFQLESPMAQAGGMLSLLGLLQQQKLREQQMAQAAQTNPLQLKLLEAQIAAVPELAAQRRAAAAKATADAAAVEAQRLAQAKLAGLFTPQGYGQGAPVDAVATGDQAAIDMLKAAGNTPMSVGVPNQATLQSLMLQAAPQQAIPALIRAQTQPPQRGIVVPAGAGYIPPGGTAPIVTMPFNPREPRPEPAPTRGQVIDPKDNTRLLEVDLRTYRGGSLGDAGVFGVAGREPVAARREEKEAQGREHLKSELDTLRAHYDTLKAANAIPSSENAGAGNILPYVQSSGVGQIAGRVFGTKEQDARNQIQSAKMRLLNAIKNATGMSAQQLNSNVELRAWLDAVTDPNRTYESNIGILDSIEMAFVKGEVPGTRPIKNAPAIRGDDMDLIEKYLKPKP